MLNLIVTIRSTPQKQKLKHWFLRTLCRTGIVEHFLAEEFEAGATVHLTLDELKPVDLALSSVRYSTHALTQHE